MLSQEFMLETFPPATFLPESGAPTSTVLPDTYAAQQERQNEPINVGALQAGQVQAVVESATSGITGIFSSVGTWLQSTGNTLVFIAVLGLGAWALSSMASMRRR